MKIRCRILDNLKACGALRLAGTEHELDLSEADIERLTERGVIQPLDTDDDVMLLGSNVQPSVLYTVQGVSVPLGDVVRAAWQNSKPVSRRLERAVGHAPRAGDRPGRVSDEPAQTSSVHGSRTRGMTPRRVPNTTRERAVPGRALARRHLCLPSRPVPGTLFPLH